MKFTEDSLKALLREIYKDIKNNSSENISFDEALENYFSNNAENSSFKNAVLEIMEENNKIYCGTDEPPEDCVIWIVSE